MTSLLDRINPRPLVVLLYVVLAALAALVGVTASFNPLVAVSVALVVLAAGLTAVRPMLIPLLTLPTLLIVVRTGAWGVDLSVSDAALAAAVLPAVVLGVRPYSPQMTNILWLTAVYQASTLFTVVANPYTANTVEWLHAWFLTGGALIVGWGVGRAGMARTGIWLIFAMACLLSLTVVVQFAFNAAQGSFGPVYVEWPFAMHKNFTGTTLGVVAAVAYAAPPWLAPNRRLGMAVFWWCVLGVLLSQSGQAIIAMAVALAVTVFRSGQERRRSKLILLAAVPAIWAVVAATRAELASGNVHSSTSQRLTWYADSLEMWQANPIVGVGLRWWYTDRFAVKFQPPNAELEVLTSTGIVGLVGFLTLMIGTLVILWHLGPTYGGMAFAAVLSRFVQGQFDLFWVAVQISLAFAIAGVSLGAKALNDEHQSRAVQRTGAGVVGR